MKAKRLILAVILVCVLIFSVGICAASAVERKVGHLAKLNMSPEEFKKFHDSNAVQGKIAVFTHGNSYDMIHLFYDSLASMKMALDAGEVDEISLPEAAAEYFININDGYTIASIVRTLPSSLSFGFRKDDDPALRNKFNEALLSMKADGTLAILREKYIADAGLDEPEPVNFAEYQNIDTRIKIAVTGDLPPIDFVDSKGKPAGFNTAVIAEIGKRLHANIELVDIDSAARASALASGRVDAVLWFQFQKGADVQPDIPEGIALSESYYSWNEILNVRKK